MGLIIPNRGDLLPHAGVLRARTLLKASSSIFVLGLGGALTAACSAGTSSGGLDVGSQNGAGTSAGLAGAAPGNASPSSGGGGTGGGASLGGADNGGAPTASCTAPSVGLAPLRRLTRDQLQNTLISLTGLESTNPAVVGISAQVTDDEKVGAFRSNAVTPVSRVQVEQYASVAADIAAAAAPALSNCNGVEETLCASQFIAQFGRRAFRRPLAAEEAARYQALYDAYRQSGSHQKGIQLVVEAMLQSPHLLYHLEFGEDTSDATITPLTQYEIASRLSYFLWNTTPDEALLNAAESGTLETAEQTRDAAQRLLDADAAHHAIAHFHLQWLEMDHLESLTKDPATYPEFSAELTAAMQTETTDFADYVIRRGDGTLRTLLTAPYSLVPEALFDTYGIARPDNYDPAQPVPLNPAERAGILTQPAFLASHAHPNQTSPVRRGVSVRKSVLCQPLPDPPPTVDSTPPAVSPDATTRERFAAHTEVASCAACHQLIDPIGLGFEHYDAVGRYRSAENGLPVDASGEIVGVPDGQFVGAVELASLLAGSATVQHCLSSQWFTFAMGRGSAAEDECSLEAAHSAFAATDYNLRDLILTLVTTDAFRYRAIPAAETAP